MIGPSKMTETERLPDMTQNGILSDIRLHGPKLHDETPFIYYHEIT